MREKTDNESNNIGTFFEDLAKEIELLDDGSIEKIIETSEQRKIMRDKISDFLDKTPRSKNITLNDLNHRLWWLVGSYFKCAYKLKTATNQRSIDVCFNVTKKSKNDLLDTLRAYKDINTNIAWITTKEKMLWIIEKYIKKEKIDFTIGNDIIENTFDVECSERVIESIIYELLVNYSKYWKNWSLNLNTKDNSFIVNLNNIKQQKDDIYSSNDWLNILKQYLNEVWGTIDYDYSQDECMTTVRIPIKSDKEW